MERAKPPRWLTYVNKFFIAVSKLGIGGGNGPLVLAATSAALP
ncbi:MAG: hypothetical protein ACSLE7_00515 [Mycobacterium sp.]